MAIPTVLKIGGSLLTQSDWHLRLRDWLQQQPLGLYLTIVGGGEVVEATLDDLVSAGVVDAQVLKYSARGIRCELVML